MIFNRLKNEINKWGKDKECVICNNQFSYYLPYQFHNEKSGFIKDLEIIGSDTKNFSCPHCMSHDRERHLFMYFNKLSLWDEIYDKNILHFAPEQHITKKLASLKTKMYVKADFYPTDDSIQKIDITQIPYDDGFFDFLICNHVLEHIEDISKALQEIHRVLSIGGQAILQTPYSSILAKTFQDQNINNNILRKKFYGQSDHVRVFGNDFFTMLEDIGFCLNIKKHKDCLYEFDAEKYGVNIQEDLILISKN